MIPEATLRLFCYKKRTALSDVVGRAIQNPFNIGEYTYATNGQIAIQVPKQQEFEDNQAAQRLPKLVLDVWDNLYCTEWIDLPDEKTTVKSDACRVCRGSGKTRVCPECSGTGEVDWISDIGTVYTAQCKICDGHGAILDPKSNTPTTICEDCGGVGTIQKWEMIKVGTRHLNGLVISPMYALINVKIAIETNPRQCSAVPFKFDGGIGIVMPYWVQNNS